MVTQALDTKAGGVDDNEAQSGSLVLARGDAQDDPLLPMGQDSKRYRVIGNGVATPVAFWIGTRLMAYLSR